MFQFLHTDTVTLTPALGAGGRHALQKTDFTQNPAVVAVIASWSCEAEESRA